MGLDGTMTVAICARNAERFVRRAVASAFAAKADQTLLVDDYSEDATATEALAAATGAFRVVRPREPRGLGNARQTGLEAVETEYLMWLDADDALLPERVERAKQALASGADLVFDACELIDGESGEPIRELAMPGFMTSSSGAARLFERNYLPGPAWPAMRASFARRIGYDPTLPTGEDLDFNLRAVVSGGRFAFLRSKGYAQYHYASSLSRDLDLQRACTRRALEKHAYVDARDAAMMTGLGETAALWQLVSMAVFREDFAQASAFLDELSDSAHGRDEALEENGPWPVWESWRYAFYRGTLDLLMGGEDLAGWLERASKANPSADALNNRGVSLARRGRQEAARQSFAAALERFPGYLDARLNLEGEGPLRVTSHPLRRLASRSEY